MGITCWAPSCNHNNMRESCNFFRFPVDKKELQKWLLVIRRDCKLGSGARLCSCHFQDAKKSNGPTIFHHNQNKSFSLHYLSPEKKKSRLKTLPSLETAGPSTSLDLLPTAPVLKMKSNDQQTVMLEAENYLLQMEVEKKDKIITHLKMEMSYYRICESDKLILEYTGLPTKNIFDSLYELISDISINYYLKWKVDKMNKRDQLLMALMKLRHNYSHTDLAFRFNVSQAVVTNVVLSFIHLLHVVLYKVLMKNVPKRSKNKSCLPSCASTFTNCRIIIDCTEISSAVPRKSMKTQRLTYSSYKHDNTLKGLVGVAPNGVVTFISSLYPGSTSDKQIVAHCGIVNELESGDLVIADKGFLIKDLLPNGVALNIPPFLSTPQFTPEQVQRTECIARARIHVERAIRRMKSYKILRFIPDILFPYSSMIFKTVGALTNLQYPLIKEVSQFYCDGATEDIQ